MRAASAASSPCNSAATVRRAQVSRGLEDGWRPVPTLDIKQGEVRYRQRVCVAPADDRPPSPSAGVVSRSGDVRSRGGDGEFRQKRCRGPPGGMELPSAEKQPLELTPVKGGVVATSAGGDLAAFAEDWQQPIS